ncbi:recombinase family protein [Streptomyces sp. NPDC005336]|uniref:recombinase family protein n=1 Tax=Streptomyces sp. NPDC005336 TaxID=3157035 RepID=UPI0033B537EA
MPTSTATVTNATAEPPISAPARTGWGASELAELALIEAAMENLPPDAPRALLSVRLSVWTDDSTSPVRQEIDVYRDALSQGHRVVGVARDLGTSATKVAPWDRKQLGHWLKDRAPEFDVLHFWKYDRFIRSHFDLAQMIKWCQDHGKLLVSVQEKLDLSDVMGRFLANALALVAQIEALNTGKRVGNLWEYSRRQEDRWFLGSPVYGYTTEKADVGKKLVADPFESRVVRYMVAAYLRKRSGLFIAKILNRAKAPAPSGGSVWQSKTVIRILKNPAITGVRVMTPRTGKKGETPVPVYGNDGRAVRVAEPLICEEDFKKIQTLMAAKARKDGTATTNKSPFLGVLKHGRCGMNVTLHVVKRPNNTYEYLRCSSDSVNDCGEGFSAVSPRAVYETITDTVLTELGQYEVVERHYVRGQEEVTRAKHLQDTIAHYMKGLAPGGQFSEGGFLKKMAEENLANASQELESIDPTTLVDRWEYKRLGRTFAERWRSGGLDVMQEDLINAGVTIEIRVDPTAHPDENLTLNVNIPKDVEKRLVMKPDAFASPV